MKITKSVMRTLTELFAGDDTERITDSNKRLAAVQIGVSVFAILFYIGLIVLWIVGMTWINSLAIRIILGAIAFLAIALVLRTVCLISRTRGGNIHEKQIGKSKEEKISE